MMAKGKELTATFAVIAVVLLVMFLLRLLLLLLPSPLLQLLGQQLQQPQQKTIQQLPNNHGSNTCHILFTDGHTHNLEHIQPRLLFVNSVYNEVNVLKTYFDSLHTRYVHITNTPKTSRSTIVIVDDCRLIGDVFGNVFVLDFQSHGATSLLSCIVCLWYIYLHSGSSHLNMNSLD